ncbi:MAG: transcription antitermination factor NusB, partial [Ruminococcus sp.]|nr:transcription antitermination factor NusB [Ruminococcus sp.]
MTRREIRDSAFKLLFEQLLRDDDIQELYDIAEEISEITVNDEVKKLVDGTLEHKDELDEI